MPKRITEKSCDPQLNATELPSPGWLLSDLTSFAQQQNEIIVKSEKSLASHYWRLGLSLTLTRQHFTRGQWGKQMEALGIERTRASKAMAIYRTFVDVETLADKSIEEAYKARTRKLKPKRNCAVVDAERDVANVTTTEKNHALTLRGFLCDLKAQADFWIHEAAFVESSEAADLLDLLDAALQTLHAAEVCLKKQCART